VNQVSLSGLESGGALLNFWVESFVKDIKTILDERRFYCLQVILPAKHFKKRLKKGSKEGCKKKNWNQYPNKIDHRIMGSHWNKLLGSKTVHAIDETGNREKRNLGNISYLLLS
jgi:hypothetical protein